MNQQLGDPNPIPRPRIAGDYLNVYVPRGDVYQGHTPPFANGQHYETWVPNDHCFVKDDDGWHIFGITHPKPETFISDYNHGEEVHGAEEMLFHAFGAGKFKWLMHTDAYTDQKKVLYPHERDGEMAAIHSPYVVRWDGLNRMIYGPGQMRYAASWNLKEFEPGGVLFEGHESARDPNIFFDADGSVYLFYASENKVCYRKSRDMKAWSEEMVLQVNPFSGGTSESPIVLKRQGHYYLFWCLWDGQCGAYDHRTFVYGSDSLEGLKAASPLTMLNAHAPEVLQDEDGDWYISSAFYPYNGVNVAPLEWV